MVDNMKVSEGGTKMGLFTKEDDEKKIVTDEQTHEHGKESHDPDDPDYHESPMTCREKLREVLHTQKFQIAVIALVVLDCILVVGELILDYEALAAAKGCSTEGGNSSESGYYSSYSNTYKNDTQEEHVTEETHVEEEEEHAESPTKIAAEVFHIMSLVILSVFVIELALKMFAQGAKFFHSKLEVFDGIVIIISFILDIITLVFAEQFAVLDLIIILRLWRIVRIVNGVVLSVEQQAEKKIHHHKKLKRRALYVLKKFEAYSEAQEEEIAALRGLLHANKVEINEEMIKNKPVKPHYDKKLHLDTEPDGSSDHTQVDLDWTQDPQYAETSQPPDYATTLQA